MVVLQAQRRPRDRLSRCLAAFEASTTVAVRSVDPSESNSDAFTSVFDLAQPNHEERPHRFKAQSKEPVNTVRYPRC